jgi:hypothetical protein
MREIGANVAAPTPQEMFQDDAPRRQIPAGQQAVFKYLTDL